MKIIEEKLTINDVANIIDKSPQYIRVGLQQQRLPFGTAVQMSSEWSYHVSKKLLEDYIGVEKVQKYLEEKGGVENEKDN